jgi:hypothetical protein
MDLKEHLRNVLRHELDKLHHRKSGKALVLDDDDMMGSALRKHSMKRHSTGKALRKSTKKRHSVGKALRKSTKKRHSVGKALRKSTKRHHSVGKALLAGKRKSTKKHHSVGKALLAGKRRKMNNKGTNALKKINEMAKKYKKQGYEHREAISMASHDYRRMNH